MSEVINNRQQRIDVMKSLIRRLHEGGGEDEVQQALDLQLAESAYGDVFMMEMQLIQEGIPAESIQRLCDTHTRVLKKQLDQQETPAQLPGHPVHTFLMENRQLAATTAAVRGLIDRLREIADASDATPVMREIQQQLNDLMDVDKHYKRKENLLFPHFEKNNLPGPPTVMWGKDDEVRTLLRETIHGLQQIDTLEASEARAYADLAVTPAITAVDEMIYKEEKILFPTALDLLTEQDWYEVYLQSDEYGYCLVAPTATWQPVGGVHTADRNPAAEGGRIHMPTGSFSLDELIATFQHLPFDLTFVDKDDTVRYFSPGKDRIFDRSRAILGRKVQYCHPPKSVHIVNKIVEDFRSGRQNQARFWITMRGRFILICYYALRGQAGDYMGTLEVTQDLTELRSLEGERRLLTYDQEPQP